MDMEDIELQEKKTNGDYGATCMTAGNGGSAAERGELLNPRTADHNGEMASCSNAAENGMNLGNAKRSSVCRVKKELNEVVFWKIRLWMVVVFIFLLIAAVILISLLLCSLIYDDPDEKFDPSLFKVPLYFNGSFQLPNLAFTEELYSSENQALAANIENKLSDLYRASPALGRYFNNTEIHGFRNGSVIVDYQLTFLMPEENQDQLRNFTLSREMVYNVFRQFLYDQEADESAPTYIDPVSLIMFLGH
ncbi:TPA-induced transmembrane protein isoform X1 [Larimichthys crocea]|uniref:TPA-induced transmembrane protein isoform X1 n=2 Tax=Larimichthys crocea TaxID=215358 RepID=UPI000F5F638B|nr:TPA-induced transmembrane protein isoform X1 [Larimichthys crocea]